MLGLLNKCKTSGEIPFNSLESDELEEAILDLEELANKISRLKQLMESKRPLSDSVTPSWKFVKHYGTSTKNWWLQKFGLILPVFEVIPYPYWNFSCCPNSNPLWSCLEFARFFPSYAVFSIIFAIYFWIQERNTSWRTCLEILTCERSLQVSISFLHNKFYALRSTGECLLRSHGKSLALLLYFLYLHYMKLFRLLIKW